MSFDSIQLRPGELENMGYQVGDIVEPDKDNQHWQPVGLMIVVAVNIGKRSGMAVICAEDSTGKRFTGFIGAFNYLGKGSCKI